MAEAFGLPMEDLPDDQTPVEALVVVKVLLPAEHPDGPYALTVAGTGGLFPWDAVGMARYAQLTAEQQMLDGTEGGDG